MLVSGRVISTQVISPRLTVRPSISWSARFLLLRFWGLWVLNHGPVPMGTRGQSDDRLRVRPGCLNCLHSYQDFSTSNPPPPDTCFLTLRSPSEEVPLSVESSRDERFRGKIPILDGNLRGPPPPMPRLPPKKIAGLLRDNDG